MDDIKDFAQVTGFIKNVESAMKINKAIDMEIDRMKSLIDNGKNDDECKIRHLHQEMYLLVVQSRWCIVYCGYHYKETLGGVIALSGYMLNSCNYPKEIHEANQDTNLLVYHGSTIQLYRYNISAYFQSITRIY